MDRKKFITTCGAFCAGGVALVPLLEGCVSATKYITGVVSGETVTILTTDFDDLIVMDGASRPFVLVKIPGSTRPICVYRLSEAEYVALSTVCTHRGCEVRPTGEALECPCHGSEYSLTGEVLRGPAEKSLKNYRVSLIDEKVVIHL